MGYFSNSSHGAMFDAQCEQCEYGDLPCPIAGVQVNHNYNQVGNDTAREILSALVHDDGECQMLRMMREQS